MQEPALHVASPEERDAGAGVGAIYVHNVAVNRSKQVPSVAEGTLLAPANGHLAHRPARSRCHAGSIGGREAAAPRPRSTQGDCAQAQVPLLVLQVLPHLLLHVGRT